MADGLSAPGAGAEQKPKPVHSDRSLILRIRTDYLKYEREMEHADLQDRLEEEKIRRDRRRFRLGLVLAAGLVLVALGITLTVMIRAAASSRTVVVTPFHASATLDASGLDGVAIARSLADQLTRLQRATSGMAARRGLVSAWSDGVNLSDSSAHFSLDALPALLRSRYGHDLNISGELRDTGAGEMALTVRAGDLAPKTLKGPFGELVPLSKAAAEYVFSESQPGLWASYLAREGRYAEVIEFSKKTYPAADVADKPYLLNAWGLAIEPTGGSPRDALALYRQALKLKPDYWNAWTNAQNASINLGDEQGAWQAGQAMGKVAGGRPGHAPEPAYQSWDLLTWNLQAALSGHLADPEAGTGVRSIFSSGGSSLADLQARMHDLAAAELTLQSTKDDPNDPTIAAMIHFVRERLAIEAGDTPRALAVMDEFRAAYANPAIAADIANSNCWIAPAAEAAGHPQEADAVLAAAGSFVDCYRFRADILDARGDWPGARKSYAAAIALTPDLPAAYYSWGLALIRHGDLSGAAAKFKEANLRAPHWADPLKAWGDVLVQQGQSKEALAKYREALKYAPNWAELKGAAARAPGG